MKDDLKPIAENIIGFLKDQSDSKSTINELAVANSVDIMLIKVMVRSLRDDYELVRTSGTVVLLSKKGYEFVSFKELEKKEIQESQNKLIESEIKGYDLTIKKWQKKTFWWLFCFSLFSFLLSVYSFIKLQSITKSKESTELNEAKKEPELSKQHTSTLIQKSVDSL
ncbi:hypothetical protein ACH3O9_06165 [Leeuwenhoekiella sp. A16]|uniref:hypothetical protein n=1 Tax=unclassified Leeuwenhoekiella TaxID=2615029 RepID=UPI003A7FAD06